MPSNNDASRHRRGEGGAAKPDRRDRPVEREGDRDIKQGGMERTGADAPAERGRGG